MRSLRIDLRGTGDSEGLPDDEYTPAEQADLIAAIAWIAAADVVQRQGRDDGHLLGRLQFAPGRDAPAAGPEGDHHGLRLGRPLQRRCALHAGLPAARQFRLVVGDVCLRLAAARSRHRGRALARDVDRTPQALQVSGAHLVRASAARRLLAPGLGLRELRRDRMRRLRRRRLGGRLFQRRRAPGREAEGALHRPRRAVGPCLSAQCAARAGDRLPAGGAALLGPLAEGPRHRPDGGAEAAGLDEQLARARPLRRRAAGALDCASRLAGAGDPDPGLLARCARTGADAAARRERCPSSRRRRPAR